MQQSVRPIDQLESARDDACEAQVNKSMYQTIKHDRRRKEFPSKGADL